MSMVPLTWLSCFVSNVQMYWLIMKLFSPFSWVQWSCLMASRKDWLGGLPKEIYFLSFEILALFFSPLSSSFFNPLQFCYIGFFTGGLGLLWEHTLHSSACLGQYPSLYHFSASPRRIFCVGLLRLRSTTEAMKGSITHFHRLGNLNGSIINSYKLQFPGQISRVKRNKTALLEREKKDKVVKKNWKKQSTVKDHESPCLFILSKNIDPCNIL